MKLKGFQKETLNQLDRYLAFWNSLGDPSKAYDAFWAAQDATVGLGDLKHYNDVLTGVPHICFKVPTGGGKTYIACNSIQTIFSHLPPQKKKVVVWLVPSDSILDQTFETLSDPNHPYRQTIESQWGSRVEVYSKNQLLNGQNFNVTTVEEQLSIFVLSYDTFRSRTQDNRKVYESNGALASFVANYSHRERLIQGIPEDCLANVINQMNPVIIVDESHNATSELSTKMLKDLNPSVVLDLTATPRENSNIIAFVSAAQLKAASMVKLPVIAFNRASVQEVFVDAISLRNKLEKEAIASFQVTHQYIRPIVLFQAQPKNDEENETFDKIKEKLIEAGIPENQIKIKTANKNEIKGIDLKSPDCPVRYIITVNALKEGWDCPFAYILASVANRSSTVDVEQILGRVLRLPYTTRQPSDQLNLAFVLSSSNDFNATISSILQGLNSAGYSKKDFRAASEEDAVPAPVPPAQGSIFSPEGDEGLGFSGKDVGALIGNVPEGTSESDAAGKVSASVDNMLSKAAEEQQRYEQESKKTSETGEVLPQEVSSAMSVFPMNEEYAEAALALRIPQLFVPAPHYGLLENEGKVLLDRHSNLEKGFDLSQCPYPEHLLDVSDEAFKVDVETTSGGEMTAKVYQLRGDQIAEFKDTLSRTPEAGRLDVCRSTLLRVIGAIPAVSYRDLSGYIDRIIGSLDSNEVVLFQENALSIAFKIKDFIEKVLLPKYRLKMFKESLDTNLVSAEMSYSLPKNITPTKGTSSYGKSLYVEEEDDMNGSEIKAINKIASCESVLWWHRIRDSKPAEFVINGFINHYPDFMVCTKNGNLVLIEVKGDQLANEDSRNKIYLGNVWQSLAGPKYKYFMVFLGGSSPLEGGYTLDQVAGLISHL